MVLLLCQEADVLGIGVRANFKTWTMWKSGGWWMRAEAFLCLYCLSFVFRCHLILKLYKFFSEKYCIWSIFLPSFIWQYRRLNRRFIHARETCYHWTTSLALFSLFTLRQGLIQLTRLLFDSLCSPGGLISVFMLKLKVITEITSLSPLIKFFTLTLRTYYSVMNTSL